MTGRFGLTVYGCEPEEAEVIHQLAPRFGVVPAITGDAVSEDRVLSVPGTRCISVGHKSEIPRATLRALHEAGVEHLSTRSIGMNHIDATEPRSVGGPGFRALCWISGRQLCL